MLKRKHMILAAAAAAVSPLASHAATVVFSYGTINYGTTLSNAGVIGGTTGTTAVPANDTLTNVIPVGDYFSIPVNVSVTGNANPEFGGPYATSNGAPQPKNLGLNSFVTTIADSAVTTVSPVAGTGTNTTVKTQPVPTATGQDTFTSIDASVFNAATSKGVIQATGTVGDPPTYNDPIAGTINSPNVDPSSATQLNKLTLGTTTDTTGDNGSIWKNLIYKVLANGTAVLTPNFQSAAVVHVAQAGTTSAAPAYGGRALGAGDNVTYLPTLTIVDGATSSTATHPIVSLTAEGSQVSGYGHNTLTTLHVQGANGKYFPAADTGVSAATADVEVTGFSPATDNEVYALEITGSTAIANIIAEINASNTGVIASVPTADVASIFPGYQIELVAKPGSTSSDQDLGIDLTGLTESGVTLAAVAAVPEPASAALLFGAAGLFLGRRKRNA